ncbi:MAG: hypothetical protein K8E66_06285 [Phycisphaerales bacterium]|nr:hypothetical protein [Phycisphaerales bacterium]
MLIWAAFWLWFCGASVASDWNGTIPWQPIFMIVLPIIAFAVLGLAAPRVVGLLLIPASVFAAWYFDHIGAQLILALPMLVTGVALAITGPWARRWARFSKKSSDGGNVTPE